MKSKFSLLALMLLMFQLSFGQLISEGQSLFSNNSNIIFGFDNSDSSIQGSPYIPDDFSLAKIVTNTETMYNVRYNAVNDEMEVQKVDKQILILNKVHNGYEIKFASDGKIYRPLSYRDEDGNLKTGFFVVLSSPDMSILLLNRESKKFIEAEPVKDGYRQAKPANFRRLSDVFYLLIDGTAMILPQKEKDFLKLFPEHNKSIAAYLDSEKLKLKKEEDLLQLINYINSLEPKDN